MKERLIPRIVVATLAAVTVGGLLFMGALALLGLTIPDPLDRLVFTAVGALGGVLAKTADADDTPQAVTVENAPTEPVQVETVRPEGEL